MGKIKDSFKKIFGGKQDGHEENRVSMEEYQKASEGIHIGREGIINSEWCRKASETLNRYKSQKAVLDTKVKEANEWYMQRHWKIVKKLTVDTKQAPEPTTAWLFNSICNKHADAMDYYPQSVFLPRSSDDEVIASQLGTVVSAIKEECGYQKIYDDKWWDKLIGGSGIVGTFWDFHKHGGAGGIEMRLVSILNLFWKGKIDDIQKSPYVFEVEEVDKDQLVAECPFLKDKLITIDNVAEEYESEEQKDDLQNATVIHAWYKKAGKLHYCKYCQDEVIYASENDPRFKKTGIYMHGEYPYHVDRLYPVKNSIAGMGYVDLFSSCQMYIDKLEQAMLENAIANSKPRMLVSDRAGINKDEFADITVPLVHVENLDERAVLPLKSSELSGAAFNMLADKINEMKETSANRDFAQGSVSSGVTSGAAIAALQESGNKTSRDIIKASYYVEGKIDEQIINLLRQFMTLPQFYRVVGKDKSTEYIEFSNAGLLPQKKMTESGDVYYKLPIFDIKIRAQKQSPFSTMEENERVMAMFNMGMFRPEMATQTILALKAMDFEGKDEIIGEVQKYGTIYEELVRTKQELELVKAQFMPQLGGMNPAMGMQKPVMNGQGMM